MARIQVVKTKPADRKEARKAFQEAISKLNGVLQDGYSESLYDLWLMASLFVGMAFKKNTNPIQVEALRRMMVNCIKSHQNLKEFDFLVQCAEVICPTDHRFTMPTNRAEISIEVLQWLC